MNTPAPEPLPITNTFEAVLRNQRKGVMASELSEKLQQLTRECMATSKGGTLILKLKVTPASGDGSAMSLVDSIELKLPEKPKPNSIFYTTEDGQLVRDNPTQHQLDLKVIEQPIPEPLKQVNAPQS